MPIWTAHKTKQAQNVLANCNGDVVKATKVLRRLWRKPVTEDDFQSLTVKVSEKDEMAWKEYSPFVRRSQCLPIQVVNIETYTNVIIPDSHHPYVDKKAWGCALGIVKDLQPKTGVIIGDFGDLQSISTFARKDGWQHALASEYYSINLALDDLQNASSDTQWVYLEGNHEERARKYMAEYAYLNGLLNVPEQLYIQRPAHGYYRHNGLMRGMTWIPIEEQPFITPSSAYWHGHHYGGPGAAAKNADTYSPAKCENKPVFYGHLHTFHSMTSELGTQAVCTGFLGNEQALHYIQEKPVPWVTGLTIQEVYGEHMSWTQIHIRDGKALLNGKIITTL